MIFFKKKPKTLGLCLGSGGAKGTAHLGVIKAFEEEGIKFDCVAGTSIGSIVGGMYAMNYTSVNMQTLLKNSGLFDFQSLAIARLKGESVADIIKKYLGSITFDDLKIPYTAVAVDVNAGEVVKMRQGKLCQAMASSSAILPYLPPVKIGDRTLIDGAYMNAVPSDAVKEMGADIVIAVSLSGDKALNVDNKRTLDKIFPNNKVPICDRLSAMKKYSDFVINPNLDGFKSTDFALLDEMYEIGYETAKKDMPKIKEILLEKGYKIPRKIR